MKKFINIILIFLLFSCASTSLIKSTKKENSEFYNQVVGTWYVLDDSKPFEIYSETAFLENGNIQTEKGGYIFDSNFWDFSEKSNRIYLYKQRDQSSNITLDIISIDEAKNKNEGVNPAYISFSKNLFVANNGYNNTIFAKSLNDIIAMKNEYQKEIDKKEAQENKEYIEGTNFISGQQGVNKGKFGGGYLTAKWGMDSKETVKKLTDNDRTTKSPYDEETLSTKEIIQFTDGVLKGCFAEVSFYKGKRFFKILIENNVENPLEILEVLKKKYGKCSIEKSKRIDQKLNRFLNVDVTRYIWNDDFTKIIYDLQKITCDDFPGQESYVGTLEYSSVVISKLIEINLHKQKEEKQNQMSQNY